jgi:putative flippase GtrA
MARLKTLAGLVVRFGLAGLVNTAVGLVIILVLDPGLGVAPALANAAGYLVGGAVGFVLNRSFVFRSERTIGASGPRYAVAAAAAFVLNQATLRLAGLALGAGSLQHIAAQLCGMAVFSITLFALCRVWVFKAPATSAA